MRLHFVSRLALLTTGTFLVVATQEGLWAGPTLKWLFVGGGAVALAISAADGLLESFAQRQIDLLTAALGAWMVIQPFALTQGDMKWWSFGAALVLTLISAVGLIIHEWSTERVVHELRVTHHDEARREAYEPMEVKR
ncbi:MAG TPA: hypothetical protein VFN36_04400 [Solirubrobacteraceae bacterium]|nr:hypothetical protein [Solirubrobacteraceae bacterium]